MEKKILEIHSNEMDVNLCQQLVKILQSIILNRRLKYLEEKETNGTVMNIIKAYNSPW